MQKDIVVLGLPKGVYECMKFKRDCNPLVNSVVVAKARFEGIVQQIAHLYFCPGKGHSTYFAGPKYGNLRLLFSAGFRDIVTDFGKKVLHPTSSVCIRDSFAETNKGTSQKEHQACKHDTILTNHKTNNFSYPRHIERSKLPHPCQITITV